MHKNKLMLSAKSLVIGLILTLMVGCTSSNQMHKAPVKPQLSAKSIDGSVCFSNQDATKLGFYILELERGY